MNNTSHTNPLVQTSPATPRQNPVKQRPRFEKEANQWWAIRSIGEDNILGRGRTKEEALADLECQVACFLDFLMKSGNNISLAAEIPPNDSIRAMART